MTPKKDLNNVQRKMLDEIYTEQFDKIEHGILKLRVQEYEKLKDKVLETESKKEPLKTMLTHMEAGYKLWKKHEDDLRKMGIRFCDRPDEPKLRIDYYNEDYTHPLLQAHKEKTHEIELDLAQKRKEIRARVYGMATTYEEVNKEVSEYISTIK